MKRKFKFALFSLICVMLTLIATVQVFGATQLYLNIGGRVGYIATEIGGYVYGTYAEYNSDSSLAQSGYIQFSGASGGRDTSYYGYVYKVNGYETEFSSISCALGNVTLTELNQSLVISVYMQNISDNDRNLVPNIQLDNVPTTLNDTKQQWSYTDDDYQPLKFLRNNIDASSFISSVNGMGHVSSFLDNESIVKGDTYRIDITLTPNQAAQTWGELGDGAFSVTVGMIADIDYTCSTVLSVYQTQNQESTSWTKTGYNALLHSSPAKVNATDLSTLTALYNNRDFAGNVPGVAYVGTGGYVDVYSQVAPVYSQIDIVNIDLATGEIIGKLSDPDYPFQWYGGAVTLPAGTTLASGRVLGGEATFNKVDCYTYYPEMYVRRWVADNKQYISISEHSFIGAVHIEEHYSGTFMGIVENDSGTQGTSGYARSYLKRASGAPTRSMTQANMMANMTALTTRWQSSTTKSVKGVQGENWHAYIYDMLYLVKYADNNSQKVVGEGNVRTYSVFSNYDDSIRYSGNIGVYSSGMSYGYSSSIDATMFLTYNVTSTSNWTKNTKRILLDGYVGTNGYTSVACLGLFDPWGNAWEWIFGHAIVSDGTNLHAFVNFNDYTGSNWEFNTYSRTYDNNKTPLQNLGYVEVGYNLAKTSGTYYRYLGTDSSTSHTKLSVVGLPTSASSTASDSTGLCDYYYCNTSTSYVYGLLRGGNTYSTSSAGLFYFNVDNNLTNTHAHLGFRPSLISN